MFPTCRSQSAGRLSDLLLKAAFGPGRVGGDSLSTGTPTLRPSDRTRPLPVQIRCALTSLSPVAPPGGGTSPSAGCSSPVRVVFTVGSPPSGSTAPMTSRRRKSSGESQAWSQFISLETSSSSWKPLHLPAPVFFVSTQR